MWCCRTPQKPSLPPSHSRGARKSHEIRQGSRYCSYETNPDTLPPAICHLSANPDNPFLLDPRFSTSTCLEQSSPTPCPRSASPRDLPWPSQTRRRGQKRRAAASWRWEEPIAQGNPPDTMRGPSPAKPRPASRKCSRLPLSTHRRAKCCSDFRRGLAAQRKRKILLCVAQSTSWSRGW